MQNQAVLQSPQRQPLHFMKTILRVLAVAAGVFGLAWCMGSRQEEAKADTPEAFAATPALEVTAAAPTAVPDKAQPAAPTGTDPVVTGTDTNVPAAVITVSTTNAGPVKTTTNLIAGPTLPDSLNLSPPLSDIVKLVQAGVGEEVLLAFVTGTDQPFDAGSAEIIYLHDLGVSATVITALLEHDSTPEMQARRQAVGAAKPLPPGVALTTPATNIYTPKETFDLAPNPPEPEPVNEPSSGAPVEPFPVATEAELAYDGSPAAATVSYNYWYSSLAPYGSWVSVGGYGPCWRPTVAVCNSAWRPYGDCGRWLWTSAGWYWYSDYSWGWGPFHYGRWFCPPGLGWVWAPGRCWGPSWVSWRYTPSYCGWAPLPPAACYVPRSGFYFNSASVGIGCDFGLSASAYVFLPYNRFCDRRPYNYYVGGGHAQAIYKDSAVINNYIVGGNNTVVNRGVGLERIAQATRGNIRQVALRDSAAMRNVGPRQEQLARDGTALAVHRPDSTTITRPGVHAPRPRPVSATSVFRPGNERTAEVSARLGSRLTRHDFGDAPARFNPARPTAPVDAPVSGVDDSTARRPGPIIMRGPNPSTPVTTWPGGTAYDRGTSIRPRTDRGSTFTGNAGNSPSVGGVARPRTAPIIMRNPNPNRSGFNRPVTYPFVPATVEARADAAPAGPARSFVPGPPPNSASPSSSTRSGGFTRPGYSPPTAVAAPSAGYTRPSVSRAPAVTPRAAASRPAVSAPSRGQSAVSSSSVGSSSAAGRTGGRGSSGPSSSGRR